MRKFDEAKITTSNYVWKRIVTYDKLYCNYCGPGQGCNRHRHFGISRSWKDQTKKRKQWIKYP